MVYSLLFLEKGLALHIFEHVELLFFLCGKLEENKGRNQNTKRQKKEKCIFYDGK
jgi:hypothetical protein